MHQAVDGYEFSDDPARINLDRVCELLGHSYWASDRERAAIAKSIPHSLCYGVYRDGEQVGFARVITDHATIFWLCDVIVDEKHRGHGLGKKFVEFILSSDELQNLNAFLATRDAHSLYEKYGFIRVPDRFMYRPAGAKPTDRHHCCQPSSEHRPD